MTHVLSLQILGILCMALASPVYTSGTHWFMFVVTISFIGTLIWTFVHFLSIRESLNLPIDWLVSVSELSYKCVLLEHFKSQQIKKGLNGMVAKLVEMCQKMFVFCSNMYKYFSKASKIFFYSINKNLSNPAQHSLTVT